MKKKILSVFLAFATCFAFAGCNDNGTSNGSTATNEGNSVAGQPANNSTPAGGGDAISLRVWGPEEDQSLLKEMVEKFEAAYPNQSFNIEIGVESEATAKDTVLTDISAAADVFAFADDQLNTLVNAGALANLDELSDAFKAITGKSIDDIKALNSEGSVSAATKNGTMYALPLGSGNNFFLCYDKSVLTENDVKTWDGMLDAAGVAGKKVGQVFASGWWNGGFFLGAGFTSSRNDDGTTNVDWNKTSPSGITGVQVVEGMLNISKHSAFEAITDGQTGDRIGSGELCAIVTGTWDASACEAIWGKDNVGYAKLPTYTVAGQQVQQGCYTGYKLMAVNAHSKNVGWAAVLAEFLTNEEAQVMRFKARQLSPTNRAASSDSSVTSNPMIAASIAQDIAGGVIQDVGDNFWSPTETLGEMIAQNQLTIGDTAGIQAALDTMVEGVTAPIS